MTSNTNKQKYSQKLLEAGISLEIVQYILKLTKTYFLATKEDVNEVGNLLSGVLGIMGVGIVLIIVIAIIMGIM